MKRKPSICLSFAAGLFLYGSLLSPLTVAAPLRFALVAKQVDHPFFIQVGKGCAEAARLEGNTCLLLGPSGTAHFRHRITSYNVCYTKLLRGCHGPPRRHAAKNALFAGQCRGNERLHQVQ